MCDTRLHLESRTQHECELISVRRDRFAHNDECKRENGDPRIAALDAYVMFR